MHFERKIIRQKFGPKLHNKEHRLIYILPTTYQVRTELRFHGWRRVELCCPGWMRVVYG